MKKKRRAAWVDLTIVSMIIIMSIAAAMLQSILGYVLLAVALLIFVRVIPCARKRENLWMFFLVAVFSVPMNITLIFKYIQSYGLWCFLLRSSAYLFLLSFEELIMGAVTRRLWTRQYRLPYSEE